VGIVHPCSISVAPDATPLMDAVLLAERLHASSTVVNTHSDVASRRCSKADRRVDAGYCGPSLTTQETVAVEPAISCAAGLNLALVVVIRTEGRVVVARTWGGSATPQAAGLSRPQRANITGRWGSSGKLRGWGVLLRFIGDLGRNPVLQGGEEALSSRVASGWRRGP
jgi:hypothetical protein